MKDLTIEELEVLLCSTGYLPPRTDEELSFFNDMYEDYKPRTENRHTDVDKILKGACCVVTDFRYNGGKLISAASNVAENVEQDYSMAARNFDKLPKEILDKMKKQHNLEKNDK